MKTIKEHYLEIRSGGWPAIKRKITAASVIRIKFLKTLINAPWAIPVVIIIRCFKPWRIIRFGNISSDRIGHFAAEAGQQFAMRQLQSKKFLDLYWIDRPTCNDFWEEMVCRNFFVFPWVAPLNRWNQILSGGVIHHNPSTTTNGRDINGWLEKTQARLQFLPEENARAKSWLRKIGWREDEPFICLLVRDSAYLKADPLHNRRDWNYHNYRDSDIDTYLPAANWLGNQGAWIFRMGKTMAKPIDSIHPKVIDYAFHRDRSDFLDIWLFAHCSLCISTGTGPDYISDIYRRPLLILNYLPFSLLVSWSNAVHLPKNLVWEENGLSLTFREHLENSYAHTEQYENAGIRYIDLTHEQILEAVKERWQRNQGTWVDTEEDLKRHNRFWEILKSDPNYHKYHGWIHPEARASTTWLRSMGDDFLA